MIPTFILLKAIHEAYKSDHLKRMGAVIFKKGIILSKGRNFRLRSVKHLHPRFKQFDSIHAEVHAIIQARRSLKGASMLVVRLGASGVLRMSKPCEKCFLYITYVGIKTVYFINRKGEVERIRI